MIIKKRCSQCGFLLPLELFNKRKLSKDGHRSECKACQAKRDEPYRLQNRERIAQYAKEQYHRKKQALKKTRPLLYLVRAERTISRKKQSRERERQKGRERYWKNPEKYRLRKRIISKRAVKDLRSFYVKNRIRRKYKIDPLDISPDMVNIEREVITINRMLRRQS